MKFSIVKLLAVTLIGYAAASPAQLQKRAQKVIIGYRRASEVQARRYNAAGTLTDDGNLGAVQIGAGVYTAADPDIWPSNGWYCVILADADALERVSKAWVPEYYDEKKLWFEPEKVLSEYIHDLEDSWNPAKTLRLSIIANFPGGEVQMVIPPGLLNSNGGAMGIVAGCSAKKEDMPDIFVDYDDWHENIKGSRT